MAEKKKLEVGDWIEIYGTPFQVTGLFLRANEVPRIELKHPLEMMERTAVEKKPCSVHDVYRWDCPLCNLQDP